MSFAEALSFLYEQRPRDDGKPYSDRNVAEALEASGVEASYSYLWMLRKGRKNNPRADVVTGLAAFFRVPAGFFLDRPVYEAWRKRIENDADLPMPRGQHSILRRSFDGMSDRSQQLLAALAAHVSSLEGEDGTGTAHG
ncbi:hypothetical protein [Amycolatopsis sp. PS_44_ISF1]|uniref:hypothetical protein n=1 Tax=Amycolatopsis sp. PS_44_ISF1 TaxID=2974917 RepID=UPI0028DFCD42|nr:hypothetical protein [Amycolatopsis sp. PS_44_ISF1]MDT8910917.1 hypothetical protein [Amycolatopsis sp. PS_44_ISF1]